MILLEILLPSANFLLPWAIKPMELLVLYHDNFTAFQQSVEGVIEGYSLRWCWMAGHRPAGTGGVPSPPFPEVVPPRCVRSWCRH